jgi:hypothetical protein
MTGERYDGSFAKPVRLSESKFLFRNRVFHDLRSVMREVQRGALDGAGSLRSSIAHGSGFATRLASIVAANAGAGTSAGAGAAAAGATAGVAAAGVSTAVAAGVAAAGAAVAVGTAGIGTAAVAGSVAIAAASAAGAASAAAASSVLSAVLAQPAGIFGGIPKDAPIPWSAPGMDVSEVLEFDALLGEKLLTLVVAYAKSMQGKIEVRLQELNATPTGAPAPAQGAKRKKRKKGGAFGKIKKAFKGVAKGVLKAATSVAGTAFGGPLGGIVGNPAGGFLSKILGGGALPGLGKLPGLGGLPGGGKPLSILNDALRSLDQKRGGMFNLLSNVMKTQHALGAGVARHLSM